MDAVKGSETKLVETTKFSSLGIFSDHLHSETFFVSHSNPF